MELILIRHTAPDIAKGICYGKSNIELADSFATELKAIQKNLNASNLNSSKLIFYSSPLDRCKKLANALADYTLTHTVFFDTRLEELNFGDWELKKWDDIPRNELDTWGNDFVNTPAKNGESYIELHKRTVDFLQDIINKNHQKVVVITHAGVIRSLYAYINKIALEDSFDLEIEYGALINIKL